MPDEEKKLASEADLGQYMDRKASYRNKMSQYPSSFTGGEDEEINTMPIGTQFASSSLKPINNSINTFTTSKNIYHSNNIFLPKEIDYFSKQYRYGVLNTYQALTTCREYLFFTKPDLNIFQRNDSRHGEAGAYGEVSDQLHPALEPLAFWQELRDKYPEVLGCLQASKNINTSPNNIKVSSQDPFNHLLSNMVQSNLDVPGMDSSSEAIDTPINLYGVGYKYRGSGEASDDTFDFSLEFKDTKFLPIYYFFKAYEDYETKKHHGTIAPWVDYIEKKILHDQYCIYKFLVDEDGETILYYAKYYGVKSYNLPRDVFNATSFDNGLSYSINFNAAFVEDMDPLILMDFNKLSYPFYSSLENGFEIGPYNPIFDTVDNRPAQSAIVVEETHNSNIATVVGVRKTNSTESKFVTIEDPYVHLHDSVPGKKVYKLRWKGNDVV